MKKYILCALCVVLLFALCACTEQSEASTTMQTEAPTEASVQVTTQAPTQETEPEVVWQIPERGAETVLLFDEEMEAEDGSLRSYQVPLLAFVGGDSAMVNRHIDRTFGAMMKQVLSGQAPQITGISYTLYHFRVYTLSLLIRCDYEDGTQSCTIYNLSLEDGRLMSNAEVLQAVNISTESFLAEAKARAAEVFQEEYAGREDEEDYAERLAFTVSEENISLSMKLYIDEEGHPWLISPIADAGSLVSYPLQKEFE